MQMNQECMKINVQPVSIYYDGIQILYSQLLTNLRKKHWISNNIEIITFQLLNILIVLFLLLLLLFVFCQCFFFYSRMYDFTARDKLRVQQTQ